jgi:hypothetical protein
MGIQEYEKQSKYKTSEEYLDKLIIVDFDDTLINSRDFLPRIIGNFNCTEEGIINGSKRYKGFKKIDVLNEILSLYESEGIINIPLVNYLTDLKKRIT